MSNVSTTVTNLSFKEKDALQRSNKTLKNQHEGNEEGNRVEAYKVPPMLVQHPQK